MAEQEAAAPDGSERAAPESAWTAEEQRKLADEIRRCVTGFQDERRRQLQEDGGGGGGDSESTPNLRPGALDEDALMRLIMMSPQPHPKECIPFLEKNPDMLTEGYVTMLQVRTDSACWASLRPCLVAYCLQSRISHPHVRH